MVCKAKAQVIWTHHKLYVMLLMQWRCLVTLTLDLSLLRRELMRPTLHADNRNLCNPDHPVTSPLFGDDLQKEMKDLKETSMIGSKVSSMQ